MELTSSQMETNRYQFESFCKCLIRNAKNNYERDMRHIANHEVTFSELSQKEMDILCAFDEYPSEYFHFSVNGTDIPIASGKLAAALSELTPRKREIVLLADCLGKSDVEIAKALNMVSRTVQYQRTRSYEQMKKSMGG